MNPNDSTMIGADAQDDMPDALRWQLRGLRKDALPTAELWPGIAARIQAETQATATITALRPRARGFAWVALAASVTLAIGIGWQMLPPSPVAESVARAAEIPDDPIAMLVTREATAMTWEYKAALHEIDVNRTVTRDTPALLEIDRSTDLVRTALAQDPDARFLLDSLQRLYAKRLAITQRLALS